MRAGTGCWRGLRPAAIALIAAASCGPISKSRAANFNVTDQATFSAALSSAASGDTVTILNNFTTTGSNGGNFADVATTFNQRQVGLALDQLNPTATGPMAAMINGISLQNTAGIRQSLQMLDAELYGDAATIVIESDDMYLRTNLIHLRQSRFSRARQAPNLTGLATVSGSALATSTLTPIRLVSATSDIDDREPLPEKGWPIPGTQGWGQGFGAYGTVGDNGNAVGVNYNIAGMAMGLNQWGDDESLLGLGFGYSHTGITQNDGLGNGHVESLHFSLYGIRNWDAGYILGLIGYGYDGFYMERTVNVPTVAAIANGSYGGNELLSYLEGGLDVPVGGWTLQPLAAMRYLLLGQSGFTETGAEIANLAVGSATFDSLRYSLGGRLTRAFETSSGIVVTPYFQGRWSHEVLENQRLIDAQFVGATGGSFVSLGNVLGRDFGEFGAGITTALSSQLMLYLAYDAQISTRQSAQGGAGGFAYVW